MRKRIGNRELILVLATGAATLAAGAAAIFVDAQPVWKSYQAEFRAIVAEKLGDIEESQIPRGIQQVWVDDLERVDRCTTCHLGVSWKGLEDVEQPWTTHPETELFEAHPVERFGKNGKMPASCHDRQ